MKTYTCVCGQLIFFQNVSCVNCKRDIGFLPDLLWLSSLEPEDNGLWRPTANEAKDLLYKKCQNYAKEGICNWMIPEKDQGYPFCASCCLNEIIPDLTSEQNLNSWARIEGAKRRLVYSLVRLKLPIASREQDPEHGLAFRFLSDVVNPDGTIAKVMTGHDSGVITLNIAEADDAMRETVRNAMKEPYRTLLGHFRHEIGHYYWDLLVKDTKFLESYRELFGDERADYNQALAAYYKTGAPGNWQERYISAYSTAHPWEDWAETWAHFLHIQDVLEVANDFGLVGKRILLNPEPESQNGHEDHADEKADAQPFRGGGSGRSAISSEHSSFKEVIVSWAELAVALNSINRSMGLPDLYPFVLFSPVVAKLQFIYEVILANSAPAPNSQRAAS